jgi:hypothetical protein
MVYKIYFILFCWRILRFIFNPKIFSHLFDWFIMEEEEEFLERNEMEEQVSFTSNKRNSPTLILISFSLLIFILYFFSSLVGILSFGLYFLGISIALLFYYFMKNSNPISFSFYFELFSIGLMLNFLMTILNYFLHIFLIFSSLYRLILYNSSD